MNDRSLLRAVLIIVALSLVINVSTLSELGKQATGAPAGGPPANTGDFSPAPDNPWIWCGDTTSGCKECYPCEDDCEEVSRKHGEQQIEEALRMAEEQGILDEMGKDQFLEEISWHVQQQVEANRTACEKQVEQCIASSKVDMNACFRGCKEARNTCFEPCRQFVIEWIEVEKADGNELFLERAEFFLPEHFSRVFSKCLHCFDEQTACVEQCTVTTDTCPDPCSLTREKKDICVATVLHRDAQNCLWTIYDRCQGT